MAFGLQIEKEFDLALTYDGPTAVLAFEFNFFFPGGASDLAFLLDIALFSVGVIPIIQANYLRYTIESDPVPFPDRYRVTIFLAGEVEESQGTLGPFTPFAQAGPQAIFALPPLLLIVIAVGVAGLLGVIAYRTFTLGLGPALGIPTWAMGVGAIVIGLALISGLTKRRANGK